MNPTPTGLTAGMRELPWARELRNGLDAGAALYRQQAAAARPIAELLQRQVAQSAELYACQARAARKMAELAGKQSAQAVSLFQRLSRQAYPVPVASLF